jgi:hypothetical protein
MDISAFVSWDSLVCTAKATSTNVLPVRAPTVELALMIQMDKLVCVFLDFLESIVRPISTNVHPVRAPTVDLASMQ